MHTTRDYYRVAVKSRRFHNTVERVFFDNYATAFNAMNRWAAAEGGRNTYYFVLSHRVEENKEIIWKVLDRRLPNA